jgi:hypothetical protein
VLAFDRHSVVAWMTGIDMCPASKSAIMRSWPGSRCCTIMKAMLLAAGSASNSFLQASRPPARCDVPQTDEARLSATKADGATAALRGFRAAPRRQLASQSESLSR